MTGTAAPRQDRERVFRIRGLKKVYTMGEVPVHALRGVDLDVARGEFIVILGHSGSGKSTLLNIIGGLDVPTQGRVFYGDQELTRASESELTNFRRHSIGFVFQLYNLIPSLTARENVDLVTEIADDPMKPEKALRLVGLGERLEHVPALLCDEPTGALDISTGVSVLEALEHINRQVGTTVMVITHNAAIGKMGDRIVTLADGHISADRTNESKVDPREIEW